MCGVYQRRHFAYTFAYQMSKIFPAGHAVVLVSPTLREDLLDLLVIEHDGEGNCLQLFGVEGASAWGDVNMATASQNTSWHVEDIPHSTPECINFISHHLHVSSLGDTASKGTVSKLSAAFSTIG
jgi:hypothetical protein